MTVLRFHIKALPIISEELQPVDEKDKQPSRYGIIDHIGRVA